MIQKKYPMKNNLLYILFIFSLILIGFTEKTYSQTIPNSGFENWAMGTSGFLDPLGWTTTNGTLPSSIVQTTGRTGTYAVKLKSVSNGTGGIDGGYLEIHVGPTIGYYPTQLSGYWKAQTLGGLDQLTACIYVYDTAGNYISDQCTYTPWTSNVPNWTPFNSAVGGGVINGFFTITLSFGNLSTSTSTYGEVDDLSLTILTDLGEQIVKIMDHAYISTIIPFKKYSLNIDLLKDIGLKIDIINTNGQIIQTSTNNYRPGHHEKEINLDAFPNGIYMCHIYGEKIHQQFKLIKAD